MSDPRFIVSATLKKNLVAEINKVLRKVQSADVDAAIRAGAITELNELLEDLHAEEDVIKSAAKRIMEVATQKSSPAKRALERIWRNYVINSEAAKKVADEARAIKAAATLSGPRNTPSSVRSQRFRDDFYHGKPPSHPGMNTNTSVGHLQPGSYGGMQQGQYAAASTPELGQWQMQQQYSQPNLSQQFIQPNYQQPAAYQQMQQGAQWNPAAHQGQYDIGTRPESYHSKKSGSSGSSIHEDALQQGPQRGHRGHLSLSSVGGFRTPVAQERTIRDHDDGFQTALEEDTDREIYRGNGTEYWNYLPSAH